MDTTLEDRVFPNIRKANISKHLAPQIDNYTTASSRIKSLVSSPAQKEKRKKRSKQLLRRFADGRHSKILFTNEKLFTVEQVVNKQNDRVYAVSNPHAT
ncbi:hypothetical protein TELCIR_13146, partial [Teladorsagia circumcincta]